MQKRERLGWGNKMNAIYQIISAIFLLLSLFRLFSPTPENGVYLLGLAILFRIESLKKEK